MTATYWENRVCVVTGASAGLGRTIVRALAKKSAKLVLVARQQAPLEKLADEFSVKNSEVLPASADVTNSADIARLQEQVVERFGGIDLLCNCAGQSARGTALETTIERYQALWEVNFLSAVNTAQAFAPSLCERQGHIVNIGSLASKVAPRYLSGYPASKFALAAFSQQLRLELGPKGLHVLLVCPGPIKRNDDAPRYQDQGLDLPASAHRPAGGAKLKGIDPDWLAERILKACESRELELVVPWKVRLLASLAQLSPRLGDWLLSKTTSGE